MQIVSNSVRSTVTNHYRILMLLIVQVNQTSN